MKILCFGSWNVDYTYKADYFVEKEEIIFSRDLEIFGTCKASNNR